jgi:modification target Cys-rich repeat protein
MSQHNPEDKETSRRGFLKAMGGVSLAVLGTGLAVASNSLRLSAEEEKRLFGLVESLPSPSRDGKKAPQIDHGSMKLADVGCGYSCSGTCSGSCSGSCQNSCSGTCRYASR